MGTPLGTPTLNPSVPMPNGVPMVVVLSTHGYTIGHTYLEQCVLVPSVGLRFGFEVCRCRAMVGQDVLFQCPALLFGDEVDLAEKVHMGELQLDHGGEGRHAAAHKLGHVRDKLHRMAQVTQASGKNYKRETRLQHV